VLSTEREALHKVPDALPRTPEENCVVVGGEASPQEFNNTHTWNEKRRFNERQTRDLYYLLLDQLEQVADV
jgi:hypothetical protein